MTFDHLSPREFHVITKKEIKIRSGTWIASHISLSEAYRIAEEGSFGALHWESNWVKYLSERFGSSKELDIFFTVLNWTCSPQRTFQSKLYSSLQALYNPEPLHQSHGEHWRATSVLPQWKQKNCWHRKWRTDYTSLPHSVRYRHSLQCHPERGPVFDCE